MEKCPDCHKFFEEDWKGSKYCPKCGQTETQARTKVARIRKTASTPKVVTHTPEEQFMIDLTNKMYAEHGFDHHPTVFRNRKGSYEKRINGKSQIVFGYENLRWAMESGFREYSTIRFVWGGQGELTGLKGAWALALHEFAHVVQEETGTLRSAGRSGIDSNKYHNSNFVKALRDLQTLYPFDEVKEI